MQVFPETLKDETNNIFWNKFKVDINGNKVVEFEEFVIFILFRLLSYFIMQRKLVYISFIGIRVKVRMN
jgi:hypothetical protein